AESRALIHALHPEPLPEAEIRRILERAGGNAFYTEELVAACGVGSGHEVPPELADVLLVRMDPLSPGAPTVARTIAAGLRRVEHPLLAEVVDLPADALNEALRELVDANIIEFREDGGYAFRHALLAEAVYDDLLPGERVRLHGAYVAALRARAVGGTAAELARHAVLAHDLATAFEARVRAGDEARSVGAPHEAMQHYEKALELLPYAPADSPATAVSLTL